MSAYARLTRLVAFIGVGLFLVVAAAQGSTEVLRAPFTYTFINTCTGESVQIDGYIQYAVHIDQDATGTYHIHGEINGQSLQGIGLTSGDRYVVIQAGQNGANFDTTSVPYVATATQTFNLISAGSGDNARVTVVQHVTVDANGQVAVSFSDVTITCSG